MASRLRGGLNGSVPVLLEENHELASPPPAEPAPESPGAPAPPDTPALAPVSRPSVRQLLLTNFAENGRILREHSVEIVSLAIAVWISGLTFVFLLDRPAQGLSVVLDDDYRLLGSIMVAAVIAYELIRWMVRISTNQAHLLAIAGRLGAIAAVSTIVLNRSSGGISVLFAAGLVYLIACRFDAHAAGPVPPS